MSVRRVTATLCVTATICAAAVAAAALAACGSSGASGSADTKTFRQPGMAITFRYPSALRNGDITSMHLHVGAGEALRRAVALDHDNALLVEKYTVKIPTTKANIPVLEKATDEVVTALYHRQLAGTRTTLNGIPAITYPPGPTSGTTSEVSYVFLDHGAYELDCQWNARHAAEIKRACRQMKATIRPAS